MEMKTSPVILACDVGGTSIKLGLVKGNRLLARGEIPAEPDRGLAAAIKRITRKTRTLCREASVAPRQLSGFGLSFPGIIEPRSERILSTPAGKFDDSKELDVAKLVARELGVPTLVCNDANAALAGEWRFGAARGCASAVMMTLGTGLGTSAIIGGVPLRGQHGQAGCLGGHWTVNLNGRVCPCGNLGCAESEASTWALPLNARAHTSLGASRLAREKIIDFAVLFRLAAQGDSLAVELRDHCLCVWAAALVSLVHAYDPECAVIGGGVMRSGALILPSLRRHLARHAWTPWGKVKVKPAALGNNAGMFGVAWLLAKEKIYEKTELR
jgi:glucokinase